ncbi:MAG: mannitol dehydrogenase family protein, partial [Propionibacteriaceae bacterium]|nr:mannitol dehydrogenase family protein [Propionibacteriaceae bacterium]
ADPAIRIVSLTITEGGYNFDQVTGDFLTDNPAVQAELVPGTRPTTIFGYLYDGLRRRHDQGVPPFTIMSCDNILHNGAVARKALTAYAKLRDPAFATWIADTVHFPSSMVDRITPQTTDQDRRDIAGRYGIDDGWPVVAEAFIQWALTDDFPTGRPAYEHAGVHLTNDVIPYELMKLRLLNCSHQALAYPARLAGYEFVHEAMADPDIAGFVRGFMDIDVTPSLTPVPGEDLTAYKDTLVARFSNVAVRDTVERLAAETSDRIPKWLVPMIKERLASDPAADIRRSAAMVAAWARECEGTDDTGRPLAIDDRARDELVAAAARHPDDPLAFLRLEQFFGDLVADPRFTTPYRWALDQLHTTGALAMLRALAAA